MTAVNWKYDEMWEFYRDRINGMADVVAEKLVVRVYEANYEVIKSTTRTPSRGQEHGPAEPFVKRGYRAHRVRSSEPLVSSHSGEGGLVQHGMFIVTEDQTFSKSLNLFAVFPQMVGGLVVADHFSFCIDRGDRTRPVHLHLTEYNPLKMIPGQGTVSRVDNYLEASIDAVPRDADAFRDRVVHNKNLKNLSGLIQELMLRPYDDAGVGADTDVAATAGGAGKKKGSA